MKNKFKFEITPEVLNESKKELTAEVTIPLETVTENDTVEAIIERTAVTTTDLVKFTRYMAGTYKDSNTGEWMLSFVKFDPKTGTLGALQTEKVNGDFETTRERFKIKATQLGILNGEDMTND